MLINIELKGPQNDEVAKEYDFDLVCDKVKSQIDHFNIADRTVISSFRPQIIERIQKKDNSQEY